MALERSESERAFQLVQSVHRVPRQLVKLALDHDHSRGRSVRSLSAWVGGARGVSVINPVH